MPGEVGDPLEHRRRAVERGHAVAARSRRRPLGVELLHDDQAVAGDQVDKTPKKPFVWYIGPSAMTICGRGTGAPLLGHRRGEQPGRRWPAGCSR